MLQHQAAQLAFHEVQGRLLANGGQVIPAAHFRPMVHTHCAPEGIVAQHSCNAPPYHTYIPAPPATVADRNSCEALAAKADMVTLQNVPQSLQSRGLQLSC